MSEHTKAASVSELLDQIGARSEPNVSVGDLLDTFGDRAFGALMFVFAAPLVLPMPPGVSALLGAPLTHRTHAHGVLFVTGHNRPGDAATDWRQLAATARDARLTLVIYMGMTGRADIQQGLLCGLPAHTPAVVIQHASLPQQRHARTTLGCLHDSIEREGLGSPAVIVVGDVVRGVAAALQEPRATRQISAAMA